MKSYYPNQIGMNKIIISSDIPSACTHTDPERAQVRDQPGDADRGGEVHPPTLVDRTNALIRGLILILNHHRVHRTIRVALASQVHDYLDTSPDEKVWLKRGKFLVAYPLARYLRNTSPDYPPGGPFQPKGCLRRFMKSRFLNYNNKNTHLWSSWLQVKRSALPVSDDLIESAYDDHLETLTNIDDGDSDVIQSIMDNEHFQTHLNLIRASLVRKFIYDKIPVATCYTPSLSASFENTRSESGAFCTLFEQSMNKKLDYYDCSSELDAMTFHPRLIVNGKIKFNACVQRRVHSPELEEEWSILGRYPSPRVMGAKIQAIVEPMKVRVISKGHAHEYYLMKPLQKALHDTMRNIPSYRLIGRPFSPTDPMEIVPLDLNPDDRWISVDYKAATDNLSWKYSGRILEYILQDLPSEFRSLASRVLGPHSLFYPSKGRYEKEPRGVMQRGQLMGSILSFPILCLANMGLFLHVMEDRLAGLTTKEALRRVLINGDDQLYVGSNKDFDRHIELGRKVGLEMSVGKAYIHKKYLNINSTSVTYDISIAGATPWQIDYLNTGLFFGQNKVLLKRDIEIDDKDNRPNIVTLANRVLAGSLPGRHSVLLKSWLSTHGSKLQEDCCVLLPRGSVHRRNLFLPESVGGMGINPPRDWRFFITKDDRKYANSLFDATFLRNSTTSRPLPGKGCHGVATVRNVPWRCISRRFELPTTFDFRRSMVPSSFSTRRLRLDVIPYGMAFLA